MVNYLNEAEIYGVVIHNTPLQGNGHLMSLFK